MLLFARFVTANEFSFGTGLEAWVAENLPAIQLLDLDSNSDKWYAAQLAEAVNKAPAFALWVKSETPDAPLGAAAALLETWLRYQGPKLLLLEGEHTRVAHMGMASSASFYKGKTTQELKPEVLRFFAEITPQV